MRPNSTPWPSDLMTAMAVLRSFFLSEFIGKEGARNTHTQHDGERPTWARSKDAYLRAWRILRAEEHPGVTPRGKLVRVRPRPPSRPS